MYLNSFRAFFIFLCIAVIVAASLSVLDDAKTGGGVAIVISLFFFVLGAAVIMYKPGKSNPGAELHPQKTEKVNAHEMVEQWMKQYHELPTIRGKKTQQEFNEQYRDYVLLYNEASSIYQNASVADKQAIHNIRENVIVPELLRLLKENLNMPGLTGTNLKTIARRVHLLTGPNLGDKL